MTVVTGFCLFRLVRCMCFKFRSFCLSNFCWLSSAKPICAIIASGLVILQENAPMLLFVTTVVFLGNNSSCLQFSALPGPMFFLIHWIGISAMHIFFFRHVASECTTQLQCWNCREPGHVASNCPNEGICHACGRSGHRAKDCPNPDPSPGDVRLCNNCYKPGHFAADCTNDKACKNCRKTGHMARDCQNEPVCNLCNISGHVARQCTRGNSLPDRGGWGRNSSYRDVICRTCNQVGHMSRDCIGPMIICHNCGGRGHRAIECPSGRMAFRRY